MSTPPAGAPKVGQLVHVEHSCMVDPATARPRRRVHSRPVPVERVVEMGGFGRWRVEARRCDGTRLHLILDDEGRDIDGTEYRVAEHRVAQPAAASP